MVSGAVGKSCIVDSLNWASHREIGMTKSTCIKCDGTIFELKVVEPQGSKFKMNFVQSTGHGGLFSESPVAPCEQLFLTHRTSATRPLACLPRTALRF